MKVKKINLVFSLFAIMALASCGGKPGSTTDQSASSESESIIVDDQTGAFIITTDLTEIKEIHTDRQKTFLEFSGDYSKMAATDYPDGNDFISDPNSIKIEFEFNPEDESELKNYSVVFGRESDLSDGYEIVGNKNNYVNIVNPYLGDNYFQLRANYKDGSFDESDIEMFTVDETCPRNLKIDGLTNCRDMGGRVLADGGVIKQGMLYRTSGNNFQTKSQNTEGRGTITSAGRKEMIEHLGIKTEINVNSSTQYNINLEGTTVKNYYMDYGGNAASHFSRNTEALKMYFNLLAKPESYPAAYHCRIGTDRTGLCGIFTNGLLGVSLNEIYQDYLFSNFGNIEGKRYIGTAAGEDNIENYVADILKMAGDKLHNKVYNTLLAIGVPSSTLDSVIDNLTEGTNAQGNNAGQIVALPDNFTLGGGATVTSYNQDSNSATPKRDHPSKYVTLNSSSKSVAYTFETDKAIKGQVVAYLGNSENSTTKKISSAIGCSLDGSAVKVTDSTYKEASMGNVSGRMSYYPVILGEVDIAKGTHEIKITGTSNTMNIGSICVFPQ